MQTTTERFSKDQLLIVFLLGVLSALGPLTIDMYLPAFPGIAQSLHTTLDNVQLSLAAYFIGISAGQLFYGPITDRFGRKKPLYFGLLLYIIAAVGCAFATSINQLIAFRLLQALGGCAGMVVSRAVVRDLFKPHESAKVFSMLMLVMGVAPIIAPTLGGFVADAWGWRAIFYILTAMSTLIVIFLAIFLPESKPSDKNISLNIRDIARGYLSFLGNKSFIFYALCGAFGSAGMFAYISSSPFMYMELFGFSERSFGIIFSINAAGLILCSQLNRIFLKWYTMRTLLTFACMAMLTLGTVLLGSVLLGSTKEVFIALIFLFVSTLGFIYPNSTALALANTGKQTGSASALMGALQMLVSFLASIGVSLFFDGTIIPVVVLMWLAGISAAAMLWPKPTPQTAR